MSEADAGWFLRHRDGVEHGPFRLADIVAAAEAGNVADDTTVRHPSLASGNWVLASRIASIGAAMARRGQPQVAAPPAGPQPTPSPGEPAKATSAAASSAFRRPRQHPPNALTAGLPRRAIGSTAASGDAVMPGGSENAVPVNPDASPAIRLRDQGFPVPKTFAHAVMALFDFRFRYFVTPWIIKILWALSVAAAILWVGKLTYDLFIQPSVPAPGPRINEPGEPGWEFEPLAGQSIFQTDVFLFCVRAGMIGLLLLCARVVLEGSIVFFRVAADVGELKRLLQSDRDT